MATSALVSVSEYLNTTYRPDRDYVDGELLERHVGERPHAYLQGIFVTIFNNNRRAWGINAATEIRMRVSATRYRVPDVSVMRRSDPPDDIVQVAPLICVEVLSPRDTIQAMQARVDDYRRMGVEHIWLIDPVTRHAYIAGGEGLAKPANDEFTVRGTPIRIGLAEGFAELDDMLTQG